MANLRLFYAVYSGGLSICGANSFTGIHGLTSIGVNTRFNLEQFFEIGQLAIYQQREGIPDVEITLEKQLDGYPPVYLMATRGASTASLTGRSNIKSTFGMSIFSDQQDSASGTPLSQCTMSGVYVSNVSYRMQVQGACTESVTLVGNNKLWSNSFSAPSFDNMDSPMAITGSGGIQLRQNVKFGPSDTTVPSETLLPPDIYGITASGTNEQDADGKFGAHIQSINVSCNLGRDQLFELGRKGPYHRFVQFPVEVRCEIEVNDIQGDQITGIEANENSLTDRKIYIMLDEGLRLDLGTKNKLSQVQWAGGNAAQNGGNRTVSYSYVNYNALSVYHPQDPTTALRP